MEIGFGRHKKKIAGTAVRILEDRNGHSLFLFRDLRSWCLPGRTPYHSLQITAIWCRTFSFHQLCPNCFALRPFVHIAGLHGLTTCALLPLLHQYNLFLPRLTAHLFVQLSECTIQSSSQSMPVAPKSSPTKKNGAPKAKGAVRAKSGCYTCRIRRKVGSSKARSPICLQHR